MLKMKANSEKAEKLAKFVRENPGVLERPVMTEAMRIDFAYNLQTQHGTCFAYIQTAERFNVHEHTVRKRLKK